MTEERPIDRPIGWSGTWNQPDARARMKKERGRTLIRWLWMTFLPVALGTGTGLYFHGRSGMDLASGVIFGAAAASWRQPKPAVKNRSSSGFGGGNRCARAMTSPKSIDSLASREMWRTPG